MWYFVSSPYFWCLVLMLLGFSIELSMCFIHATLYQLLVSEPASMFSFRVFLRRCFYHIFCKNTYYFRVIFIAFFFRSCSRECWCGDESSVLAISIMDEITIRMCTFNLMLLVDEQVYSASIRYRWCCCQLPCACVSVLLVISLPFHTFSAKKIFHIEPLVECIHKQVYYTPYSIYEL